MMDDILKTAARIDLSGGLIFVGISHLTLVPRNLLAQVPNRCSSKKRHL